MLPRSFSVILAGLSLLQALSAGATTTNYNVNHNVGAVGKVYGTITTDGTIGILQVENILDWNLTLNADTDTSTVGHLFGPLSGGNSVLAGFPTNALSTSVDGESNTLHFDFGTSTFQILQIATSSSDVVWQLQAGSPFRDELVRESMVTPWQPVQIFTPQGPVRLTLGTVSAVPEPSSMMMGLLGALVVLGYRARKTDAAQ